MSPAEAARLTPALEWLGRDSNPRPPVFQTGALPLSYRAMHLAPRSPYDNGVQTGPREAYGASSDYHSTRYARAPSAPADRLASSCGHLVGIR
jgi:hypothetical protein